MEDVPDPDHEDAQPNAGNGPVRQMVEDQGMGPELVPEHKDARPDGAVVRQPALPDLQGLYGMPDPLGPFQHEHETAAHHPGHDSPERHGDQVTRIFL
jgi:hypothetical protein